MADISTTYAGLELKSPVIVGSCELTDSAESNAKFEEYGAGAVVLGSIFEEESALEYESVMKGLQKQGRNLINSFFRRLLSQHHNLKFLPGPNKWLRPVSPIRESGLYPLGRCRPRRLPNLQQGSLLQGSVFHQ